MYVIIIIIYFGNVTWVNQRKLHLRESLVWEFRRLKGQTRKGEAKQCRIGNNRAGKEQGVAKHSQVKQNEVKQGNSLFEEQRKQKVDGGNRKWEGGRGGCFCGIESLLADM